MPSVLLVDDEDVFVRNLAEYLRPRGWTVYSAANGALALRVLDDTAIDGADVLLVEDIVDSGITLNYLAGVLEQRHPRSLRIAALLDKPDRRVRPVDVAYVGFRIPDEFVVGYGLDYAEQYRNLADVCVLGDVPEP